MATVRIPLALDGADAANNTIAGLRARTRELKAEISNIPVDSDAFNSLNRQLASYTDQLTEATTAQSVFQRRVNASTAGVGQAQNVFRSFGQGINDVRFGILGVGNNISQMTEQLVSLTAQTGSTRAAFGLLSTQLAGPFGLLLILQVVIALLPEIISLFEGTDTAISDATEAVDEFEGSLRGLLELEAEREEAIIAANEAEIRRLESLQQSQQAQMNFAAASRTGGSIAQLREENEERRTNLMLLNQEAIDIRNTETARAVEIEQIRDRIALYGDDQSESGLISLQIRLNQLQRDEATDIREINRLNRERLVLLGELSDARESEVRDAVTVNEITATGIQMTEDASITAQAFTAEDAASSQVRIDAALAVQRVNDLEQEAFENQTNAKIGAASALGDILTTLSGENKGLAIAGLVVESAAGIAEVIISSNIARARALAELGPVAGSIAATGITINQVVSTASILASTAAGISSINSAPGPSATGVAGAGGTSGVSFGPTSATPIPMMNNRSSQARDFADAMSSMPPPLAVIAQSGPNGLQDGNEALARTRRSRTFNPNRR